MFIVSNPFFTTQDTRCIFCKTWAFTKVAFSHVWPSGSGQIKSTYPQHDFRLEALLAQGWWLTQVTMKRFDTFGHCDACQGFLIAMDMRYIPSSHIALRAVAHSDQHNNVRVREQQKKYPLLLASPLCWLWYCLVLFLGRVKSDQWPSHSPDMRDRH